MSRDGKIRPAPRPLADETLDVVTGADKSSTWIRVSMNPGGTPSGDPDKPVIIGTVPNTR